MNMPTNTTSLGPRPATMSHSLGPRPMSGNPNTRRISSRPSLPDPATASPSFTNGRAFHSELHLRDSVNWIAVQSRHPFEAPPTFQSLFLFINPPNSTPFLNNITRELLNTPEHISHLQRCWAILKRNDKEEMQATFGMPERIGEMRFEIYRLWVMVRLAWRIVQALKNARDSTRIAEAGEWAMYVIDMNKNASPDKKDPLPLLTLACSLTYPHPSLSLTAKARETSTPLTRSERDKMALQYFREGFQEPYDMIRNMPSNVFAKAHFARLLRRLELDEEAIEVEEEIQVWWQRSGSYIMTKERFVSLICTEEQQPSDSPIIKGLHKFARENDAAQRDSGIDVSPSPPQSVQVLINDGRGEQTSKMRHPYQGRSYSNSGSSESIPSSDSEQARWASRSNRKQ